MTNGKIVTSELVIAILEDEAKKLSKSIGGVNCCANATEYLKSTCLGKEYADFLTTLCYDFILTKKSKL
jgi:malate synthase